MDNEQYVSFETAKKLKEIGFPQNMTGGYYSEICKPEVRYQLFLDRPVVDTMYAAPSLARAAMWLRIEKHIDILPKRKMEGSNILDMYECEIIFKKSDSKQYPYPDLIALFDYVTYEDAIEAGILWAIDNILK